MLSRARSWLINEIVRPEQHAELLFTPQEDSIVKRVIVTSKGKSFLIDLEIRGFVATGIYPNGPLPRTLYVPAAETCTFKIRNATTTRRLLRCVAILYEAREA